MNNMVQYMVKGKNEVVHDCNRGEGKDSKEKKIYAKWFFFSFFLF